MTCAFSCRRRSHLVTSRLNGIALPGEALLGARYDAQTAEVRVATVHAGGALGGMTPSTEMGPVRSRP